MAVNNLVKSLQNIMRSDAGVNGDAQRIEQMVWMFFLKVYDAQELDWECEDEDYQSIIPEQYRWRNWAPSRDENGQKVATALTGDELLRMVNDMFDALKNLPVTEHTKRGQSIVRDVFSEVNQYMKNGVLLRQMIDKVDEIDFTDSQDIHAFGDIYESLLKDLQGAGHAGEFYTPRALTDLIIEMLDPRIGETVGDFAMGTGGFLTSALHHLQPQQKDDDDVERFQHSVIGQEWKPFPYLLAVTNLFLHGIKEPNVLHGDSLARNVRELKESDKVDVIAMNPPYGGATEASVKGNFPQDMRSSETADLFLVLIIYRLRERGRAGVIVPDGFLFGTDGAKLAIKQKMLRDFNLHTIIRLPGSIFSPYTSILQQRAGRGCTRRLQDQLHLVLSPRYARRLQALLEDSPHAQPALPTHSRLVARSSRNRQRGRRREVTLLHRAAAHRPQLQLRPMQVPQGGRGNPPSR